MDRSLAALNVRQVRTLAARALQAGRDLRGPLDASIRRDLERLDREARFSPEARNVFQDLLARLGQPTVHPIRLPLDDEPYWFRCARPFENYQAAPEVPAAADVVVIGAGLTGASAAYHLADADDGAGRVVVLDRGVAARRPRLMRLEEDQKQENGSDGVRRVSAEAAPSISGEWSLDGVERPIFRS